MTCPHCLGIEKEFNADVARRELGHYRQRGPGKATRLLISELTRRGLRDSTLLDIGGGVGAVQHAALEAGATKAIGVDASSAYLAAAKEEAARRGLQDKVEHWHGDFVALAPRIPPVDVVTLDRVVCCYPDAGSLVDASAAHARRMYGLVHPIRTWWMAAALGLLNLFLRLRGSTFRVYLHPRQEVEDVLERRGFQNAFHGRAGVWQVALYLRPGHVRLTHATET
ncbi:MAG TPA: class I SAM-dependent methyltransferase [Anaerolineales bacterium]|nr:class I SAM-dependent methyltransferase [Anaerolineales bacterium]